MDDSTLGRYRRAVREIADGSSKPFVTRALRAIILPGISLRAIPGTLQALADELEEIDPPTAAKLHEMASHWAG